MLPFPVVAEVAAAADLVEHALSSSYAVVNYQAKRQVEYGTVSAAYDLWLRPGVNLRGGGRLGFGERLAGGVCFEGFVAAALEPHFATSFDAEGRTASWRPNIGIETGVTSASIVAIARNPSESFFIQDTDLGVVYGVMNARPLRFRFSGYVASVLGVGVGTGLDHPGRALRLQIELVSVGLAL